MTENVTSFDRILLKRMKKYGGFRKVKATIEKNNLFNVKDRNENTLLHYSVMYMNPEILKYLIKSGSKVDARNARGRTPLILAIRNHKWWSITALVLIKAGASIYESDNSGKNALQLISQYKDLGREELQIMFKIVKRDCSHDQEKVAKMLFNAKWPLPLIVLLRDVDLTKTMLRLGYVANVNAVWGPTRKTALHVAVESADVENVKVLLEHNANIHVENSKGKTPLMYLYPKKHKMHEDNFQILKMLLEQFENRKHIDPQHVYRVFKFGNKNAIKLLFQYGIRPMDIIQGRDDSLYEWPALHMLIENKNPGLIKQLRNQSFDVNVRNGMKGTPLIVAAIYSNVNATKLLLDRGADVEAVNDEGNTALFYAILHRRKSVKKQRRTVQLLLEYGSNVQVEFPNRRRIPTIFDMIWDADSFGLGELLLAQLAFKEAQGTVVTQRIENKIKSNNNFKKYFELSKQQLNMQIFQSITIFDLLNASDNKIERYLRNGESATKLESFIGTLPNCNYFRTILLKRFTKANKVITLRRPAATRIGKLMKTSYERFPLIADHIVSYLDLQSMRNLIKALD